MKEYTYYLEQFVDGQYFSEDFNVKEEDRLKFFYKIVNDIQFKYDRYATLTLAYSTNTKTLKRKDIYITLINPLEEESTRKYALYRLNGKEIEMMALNDYLQCFSKKFFKLKHNTFPNYIYILESEDILEIDDIKIKNCIQLNNYIIFYNKKHEIVCKLRLEERPNNDY